MQKLIIHSCGTVDSSVQVLLEKAFSTKIVIEPILDVTCGELSSIEMLSLLKKGSGDLLACLNCIEYPFAEQIKVLALLPNPNDLFNPYMLLSVNQTNVDCSAIDLRTTFGRVDIVGFGPGNPDLVTIKAKRLLTQAEVIFYDDLLDNDYLNRFTGTKVYVGKRKGQHSAKQEEINRLLFEAAAKGQRVVRIKGGDPMVFGRGGEEYHYLKQRFVEVTLVPGITSALAAASDAVIPLTSRGVSTSVAFGLGHDAVHNKLPQADTLVFYMGASQQQAWAKRLIAEGWSANTPVASVRNASLPNKSIKRYTLGQLRTSEDLLKAPSLVIVGYTASEDLKAQGRKWLYTGSDINDFRENGIAVHNPMMCVKTIHSADNWAGQVAAIGDYQRIVFSSPYAVKEFFKVLYANNLDARALYSAKLTSIGASTSKQLKKYGLLVAPESEDNSAKGLLKALELANVKSEKILVPCSTSGLSLLPEGLKILGNKVTEWALYSIEMPDNASRHNLEDFYGVVFTSPVTVKNFFKHYGHFPSHLKALVSGGYTKRLFESLSTETVSFAGGNEDHHY